MSLLESLPQRPLRALFFDVDDTVAPSTQPLEAPMVAALAALAKRGLRLGFVSGSSVEQLTRQVTERFFHDHFLLGTSGSHAVFVNAAGKQTEIFRRGFSDDERAEILAALNALIAHYDIRSETTPEDQLQDRGCQFTLSALGRGAVEAHKRAFDPDGAKRREWVDFLLKRLGGERFEIRVGGTTSVDITARGVDKASGLTELLAHAGILPADCLYFGDRFEETGNDYPVLRVMDCLWVRHPEETLRHLNALLERNAD